MKTYAVLTKVACHEGILGNTAQLYIVLTSANVGHHS
jgi:hypothetical protein